MIGISTCGILALNSDHALSMMCHVIRWRGNQAQHDILSGRQVDNRLRYTARMDGSHAADLLRHGQRRAFSLLQSLLELIDGHAIIQP